MDCSSPKVQIRHAGVLPAQRVEDDALSLSQLRLCTVVAHCKRQLPLERFMIQFFGSLPDLPRQHARGKATSSYQFCIARNWLAFWSSLKSYAGESIWIHLRSNARTKGIRFDSTNLRPYCMKHHESLNIIPPPPHSSSWIAEQHETSSATLSSSTSSSGPYCLDFSDLSTSFLPFTVFDLTWGYVGWVLAGMAKCNSGTSSGTSSKNLSRVMILVLHPYSICLGFRYSRAGCDFNVINFKLCLWKSSTRLQVCHWGFGPHENGNPLFCFLWAYQKASWWCCFNAWLSFWPGIAFGGVPLRFDSKLTGRTFPYSDSGHS